MINPMTAELLLPHASGWALDLLFTSAATLDYGISAQPSAPVVLARWSTLNAEDACTVAVSIVDDRLLDDIVGRERRKSVRRALASNPHLHPATRLHLLQHGLVTADEELVSNALGSASHEEAITMFRNDPSLPFAENVLAEHIAGNRDLDDAAHVVSLTGNEIIATVARYDIMFAIDLCERVGTTLQQLGRRLNVRRILDDTEFTTNDFRRIITAVGEEQGIPYVATFLGDDYDRMLEVDHLLARHALGRLDVVDANVASFCVTHGLVDALKLDDVTFETGAFGVLFADDAWRGVPALLLHHPDRDEVLGMIDDLYVVLAAVVASGNATLAGEWLASLADRFTPEVFWSLVMSSGVTIDRRVAQAFANRDAARALFTGIAERALEQVESLPDGVDLLGLAAHAENLTSESRARVATLLLQAHRMQDVDVNDIEAVVEAAIDIMVDTFDDDRLTRWLAAGSVSRPTNEEINAFTTRHPYVAARLANQPGVFGRCLKASQVIVERMRPTVGWGAAIAQDGAEEVYTMLAVLIGEEAGLWEPVLGLLDGWTSTLTELVEAARRL